MRRKLHWLLISRLAMSAALLAIVSLTERGNTPRSFVPVLATVAAATVILSAFYLAALRMRLALRMQAYIQFSLDICMVTWLVYRTGDVESPFLALYLVIIFATCALLGRTGVSLVGALAGALYVSVGVLTMSSLLPRAIGWSSYEGSELSWTQFMFSLNLVAILAVGILSSKIAERIRRREIQLGYSVSPLVYEADSSRGYVLTFQDLTEVMELEREVRRQERLAALGTMAAGLAHEIRNPLASMRGSVQVLASELSFSQDQSQLMQIVLRESDRLNRIVSDFLTYARPSKVEPTVIELASLLAETIALLRNSPELRPDHLIREEYPSEPLLYRADPNQMRQIFWNLA